MIKTSIQILKKLFIAYCIIVGTAFSIGYIFTGLGTLGLIPPPPTDWKDK